LTDEFMQEDEFNPAFSVTGPGEASFAMRALKMLTRKKEDVKETKDAEMDAVKDWYDARVEALDKQMDFYKTLLLKYIQKRREEIPDFTVSTPNGTAYIKKGAESWKWTNEEELVEFLKTFKNVELLHQKFEPDKTAIKDTFKVVEDHAIDPDTGEVIPGITIEAGQESLVLKLAASARPVESEAA
jgi:phage host-nuclease inhibitor protein Gam